MLNKNAKLVERNNGEMARVYDCVKSMKFEARYAWEKHHKFAKRLLQNKYDNKIVITKVDMNKKGTVTKIFKGTTSNSPMITMTEPDTEYVNDKVLIQNKNNDDYYEVSINGTNGEYVYYPNVIQVTCPSNTTQLNMSRRGCWLKLDERARYTKPNDTEEWIYLPGASVWGPSNEKQASKFFFTDKYTNEQWWNKVDELTGNAFAYFFSTGQKTAKILKNTSRLNMFGTTMEKFGQIDLKEYNIVIANPGINFDAASDTTKEVEDALKHYGIEFGECINDGKDYILADLLAETLGIPVEEACMYAIQNRENYIQTKCLGQLFTKEQMTIIKENVIKLYGTNNVKIYGNVNGPTALIADDNAAKLVNVEALEKGDVIIDCYALAVAKASTSRTSGQMIAKLLEKDYNKAIERLSSLLVEAFDKQLNNKLTAKFNPKAGLTNNTGAVLKDLASNDEGYMWNLLSEMSTYSKSALADMKIELSSVYNHAMFDDCYVQSCGLIDHILRTKDCGKYGRLIEVFSHDVCIYFEDDIEAIEDSNMTDVEKEAALDDLLSAFIMKYPSAGAEEFLGVRYLTLKEWRNRVKIALDTMKENNASDKLMDHFKQYCNQIPYGVTLFAAYNFIKNKLAGMDVDFDATLAIFDDAKEILINEFAVNRLTYIDYKDKTNADYSNIKTEIKTANLKF